MTDRIPNHPKPNVDRAVANAARAADIVQRARLATPITDNPDRLDSGRVLGTVTGIPGFGPGTLSVERYRKD